MDSISESEELEKFSPFADRRPFEVILRGGKPWGFSLAGGEGEESALHISMIDENSRAGNSALLPGDIVLSVNGISCGGIQAARQLVDSAFRTLTLKVLRGGWDSSRGVRPQSFQQSASDGVPRRERSGSTVWQQSAHDDSALYAQSKGSQQSAMKPSRPRRGDSFTAGRSNPPQSPSTSDPPWSHPSPGQSNPSPHFHGRSSYPEVYGSQRPILKSDRRYSDAPSRYQPRDHGRERHVVAARSSPDLNKVSSGAGLFVETKTTPVKSVKSSSDIPGEVNPDRGQRPSTHGQQAVNKSSTHAYGRSGHGMGEETRPGDYGLQSPRVSEDMYTSDMNSMNESKTVTSHCLQKYRPDYENMSLLANAPLQSEKISEIIDIEDNTDCDAPVVPPRPGVTGSKSPYSPTPPQRDPSSLKYIKVNQNHEKYPSWPVTQSSTVSEQSQPINTRAQSWTDHTNTSKEFPSKQRLAYQPGLRPLQEKNSPNTEQKGDDSSGRTPRNSSDPGFKTPEFDYDHYGRVVQKKKNGDKKGKFEDFYQNSKPGYLPPRVDSDGHSYGDKEYNFPSPPERDMAGVDRHALSQALGAEADEHRHQMYTRQKLPLQSSQPQKAHQAAASQHTVSSRRMGGPGDNTSQPTTATSPPLMKRPSSLHNSQAGSDSRHVDTATSPLASPHDSASSLHTAHSQSMLSSSQRDYLHRDPSAAGGRHSNKPYIVKPTPYYNTSTQTDVQSYAVKTSDPRARHCNVEIQVGDAGSQTSPKVEFEEKSIQARMSHEFHPSELDPSSPMKLPSRDKQNYFQYPFEGIQSIQAKYATDIDSTQSSQSTDVFSPLGSGDQASIMRKLSEEFYGGNKLGLMGEKRHSASSQEHSPKPVDSSSMSVHSGTMSQAESYSSVIIHPSESAGPFGRDDFGSQSSITDSRQDLSSLASSSRSSLRDSAPRGRNSLEYFPRTATRPLQESRKFNSLTSISHHQRERSAPVSGRNSESRLRSQNVLTVDTRSQKSGPYRDSSSASESSTPSQPKSPDSCFVGSAQNSRGEVVHSESSQSHSRSSQHSRAESADSVFSEQSSSDHREKGSGGGRMQPTSFDSKVGQGGKRTGTVEMLGRKLSMKKAYGIYDDSDRALLSPTKDSKSAASSSLDVNTRGKGSHGDTKHLDQIQEEADSSQGSREQRPELVRRRTLEDISESRQRMDSWRSDLDKRTGRTQRPSAEQVSSQKDPSQRSFESSSRPQRLFEGSIDSGVGSEIFSRTDGHITLSDQSQSNFLAMEKTTVADLKKMQQQTVSNFVPRKTGKPSFPSASMDHSPESSLYESIGTPHSPHSPTTESVSDLISKTNETLAKRADGIRRTGSTSSRASSSDYVDMSRQDRSHRETEWSRLRSSGSLHYGSNRSSLCSENTYEDISVFATATPRSSTQEMPQDVEERAKDAGGQYEDDYGNKMESGVIASPTYQNFPAASRRRPPPPPPPRSPSPEQRPPPALPPRNYLNKEEEADSGEVRQGEANVVDEAKIDFKSLFHQWENNSPREDAYIAQLRKQASKFSGQRGNSSTAPSSMSVIHSRTQMTISTSYKRQPMVAQEATSPTSNTATSETVTTSVSSASSVAADTTPPHRRSSSDISSSVDHQSPLSPPSRTKESSPKLSPMSQMPEQREDKQLAPKTDSTPPGRRGSYPARDRSVSELPGKVTERTHLSPPDGSRERSSSDTRVLAKPEGTTPPGLREKFHSAAGKPIDVSPHCPAEDESQAQMIDPEELPPPPPELLNDSVNSCDRSDQRSEQWFADESYGAYRNRSSREVGNYQRSSSAASAVRPDSQHAQAVFGDNRLGNQNWNSDSQLQSNRKPNPHLSGSTDVSSSTTSGRPTDHAGNVPSFKADSGPVRSAVKVASGVQPLVSTSQSLGQSPAGDRCDGRAFLARPYHAEQPRHTGDDNSRNVKTTSPEHEHPRSVKERVSNLERKSSFTSASTSSTPATSPLHTANTTISTSQRWANPAPFQAAHRPADDTFKPQPMNTNSNRVPNSRPMVLKDSHQPRDRQPSSSSASAAQDSSTQSSVIARPRAYSERSGSFNTSPPSDSQTNQRHFEMVPGASDSRAMPGHVRTSSHTYTERPRSTSSPYNRRESVPAPKYPDAAVATVTPRRKSEGSFLPSPKELHKELSPVPGPITASHGRQPSQEELECDQRAKELAKEVAGSEKKLSDVLSTDAAKKRMKYMDGLFSGPKDFDVKTPVSVRRHQSQGSGDATIPQTQQSQAGTAPSSDQDHTHKRNSLPKEYFMSPPKAVLEMEWRNKEETSSELTRNIHDNEALIKQKEELIEKLHKKLDLLKEERKGLQEEIQEIEALGKRVCETVDRKCENRSERDKFHTYISDLEKIVRLLLNLSGQLARAENAVQGLSEDADPKLKKMTLDKRERLQTKHAEAKQLKDDIDKRSDTVSGFLRQSLSAEELNDYAYFVKMKSKLTIELQELEDKITLGEEQIQELKKSIPERTCLETTSPLSSSPPSSPVPSSSS